MGPLIPVAPLSRPPVTPMLPEFIISTLWAIPEAETGKPPFNKRELLAKLLLAEEKLLLEGFIIVRRFYGSTYSTKFNS